MKTRAWAKSEIPAQIGRPVPPALLRFIQEGQFFVVAGHKEPAGDCVGSQLTVASVLNRIGKKALPCSAGPFKRPEVKSFEGRFSPFPVDVPRRQIRVIVMDCSSLDRVGDMPFEGLPLASVDHHASGNPSGEAVYLDAKAPSVTYMVLNIIAALGLSPTPEEAELLLFGLCTDTGFFRHVDETGPETFDAVSRLVRAGASPKRVFAMINGGKSLDSRILTGLVLSRNRAFFGGRLLLSFEEYEDVLRYGGESRDSDTIYQLLMSVEGAEAAAKELGINILYEVVAPTDWKKAYQDAFVAHPSADSVFLAGRGQRGLEVSAAFNEAGRKPYYIGSMDFYDAMGESLKKGELQVISGGHMITSTFSALMAINAYFGTPLSAEKYQITIPYLMLSSYEDFELYLKYASQGDAYSSDEMKQFIGVFNSTLTLKSFQDEVSKWGIDDIRKRKGG